MTKDLSGNERYKAKRDQSYDMMRDVHATFEQQPEPVNINTINMERAGLYGPNSGHSLTQEDPLLDHIRPIKDTTPANYGKKKG